MPWTRRCLVIGLLALAQAGVIGVLAQGWLKGNAAPTPPASCCASEKGDGAKGVVPPKPVESKEECKKIAPARDVLVPAVPPAPSLPAEAPKAASLAEPPPVLPSPGPLPPPADGLAAGRSAPVDVPPSAPPVPTGPVPTGPATSAPMAVEAPSPAAAVTAKLMHEDKPGVAAGPPPSPPPTPEAPPPPAPEKARPEAQPLPPAADVAPHIPDPQPQQASSPPIDSLPSKHVKDKESDLPPPPPSGPEPRLVAQPVGPCPWTLHIHILKGQTQMEARIDKTVKFRVSCEHLDLQAPRGSIQAQGDVKVLGPDLEGKCDRLTINWQDEQVLLDGSVYLKCRKEGQEVELKAEKLGLKLSQISPPETPPASEEATPEPAKDDKHEKPAADKKDSPISGDDMLDHP
jgi:hypothetical protein